MDYSIANAELLDSNVKLSEASCNIDVQLINCSVNTHRPTSATRA